MTEDNFTDAELAYAQARAYGKDLARLYAAEKNRRKELETTTQKLQAIFDTVPSGLAVIDNALTIIEANPRFLALFQQTESCIGQSLAELLPVENLLKTMQSMKQGMTGLGNVEVEVAEPVLRVLLVNLSPLSDEQGWVLILHDLTENKRLEGLKDEFVNIAAHELRTPLAGVMGFVGVLQEELKHSGDPMMANLANLILQSTERLRVIIDELVYFATLQRGPAHNLNIVDIDLAHLLQKTVALFRQQIEAKGITCHLEFPNELLVARGDQFILSEVFYQLLSNAIIFNKPEGKITIRVYGSDTPVKEIDAEATLIEIEDTGIGIPQVNLDKIFDKFYQVEEHLTRGVGGLGLGLTIARRGVEQHGGQLTVTSQLGQGSTFRVVLPHIIELSDISIDTRLDIAHQQLLTYAKEMAQAVASQRRISKRMEQVKMLSADLVKNLEQLSSCIESYARIPDPDHQSLYSDILSQSQDIVQELIKLSEKTTT